MGRPPKKSTENAAAETKTTASTTAAKSAAEKKTVTAKTETKSAAEKKSVKSTADKTEKKSAAGKSSAGRKTTADAPKTTTRRTSKKIVTIETICTKVGKRISKDKAAEIKEKIAVDIEVWGFEDGPKKMYIEISEGKAAVAPYSYDDKDFSVYINIEKAGAFADGKISLKELFEDSDKFHAEGNIVKAVKLAAIFDNSAE